MTTSKKITKLTDEQIAQIPGWVDKWIKIGLTTDRADFDRAEKAIYKCYDLIKQPHPKTILRCGSPWAAIRDGCIYSVAYGSGMDPKQIVNEKGYIDSQSIADKIDKKKLKEYMKSNLSNYRGAQVWASWFSYVTFFRDVCGWYDPILEKFALDEELALSCGLVWWSREVAAISDRPERIAKDNGNRLHADDGMALKYPDGWGVYVWHGYRIPTSHEWIIADKDKLNPTVIEAEGNAELRRIMLEAYGFDKFMENTKAREISTDEVHGRKRRLLEMEVRGEKIRVVEVVNGSLEPDGTRRKFVLGCVRHNGQLPETPAEAVAFSYGINPKFYKETIRT